MKITAIICEYNPFHNGHLHQLNTAKKETAPNLTIGIMSGDFVQRGEMAIIDKYDRAKVAIEAGFDVVIELPTVFAVNNAEYFAYGGINLLKNLPNTTLSFGSECGDIAYLKQIADITESDEFNTKLKKELSNGISYPVAVNNALKSIADTDILDGSNNILAIEYIKNISKLGAKINLHTIKRANNYNSNEVTAKFLSATAIRNKFTSDIAKVADYMPEYSFKLLTRYADNTKTFQDMLMYKLLDISKSDLSNIFDVGEGIENRIKKAIENCNNYDEFMANLHTKRYSQSRLNRILINTLLNITKSDMKLAENINYYNVLAVKKSKVDALGYLNKYAKVITKFADTDKLTDAEKHIYNIDRKTTKLYSLINNTPVNYNTIIVD